MINQVRRSVGVVFAIAAASAVALPDTAQALSATNTITLVTGAAAPATSPSIVIGFQSLGPLLDSGGNGAYAEAAVTDLPGPTVSGEASATAGPAGPTASFAQATIDVRLSYGITLNGPSSSVSAPIFFQGNTSASGAGSSVAATTALTYTGGTLVEISGSTATPRVGQPGVEWILDPNCSTGCGFDHSFTFTSFINPGSYSVVLEGLLDVVADDPDEQSAGTIFLDPYIYLDPAWAAANPEYSLTIEPGVGNVPEPATALLLLAGVGVLGLGRRSRRSVAIACVVVASIGIGASRVSRADAVKSWSAVAGNRYKLLSGFNDEAFLDKDTGLVWDKLINVDQEISPTAASNYCLQRFVGGKGGWRLPKFEEIHSLLEFNGVAVFTTAPFQNYKSRALRAGRDACLVPERLRGLRRPALRPVRGPRVLS
jgi:hypothetical protein